MTVSGLVSEDIGRQRRGRLEFARSKFKLKIRRDRTG